MTLTKDKEIDIGYGIKVITYQPVEQNGKKYFNYEVTDNNTTFYQDIKRID